ncbi:MAG: Capsule biosynthesis protein CapA [Verrucomicrobia bacterium ADurb.Bin118]|nr:MAG: Capsule biosynthesis protein CapA [Verrucomicrobia bacterium ADurb.Bin118]
MITILIGGDICPAGKIQTAFAAGLANDIFHDLLPEIGGADLAVANLECPLVTHPTPIPKAGPVLSATPNSVRGLVAAGWHVLNLANNHSYDHGTAGLVETIATIQSAGLVVVGAGNSIEAARKPLVRNINGEGVVIYSMAEREFSVADQHIPGANPLDLISFVESIQEHKASGVFIVLLHGGKEHYDYPPPEMIRRCRFMVDMGADAVVCCHTHCPLPWEVYRGRPIIYGLGNLVFEWEKPGYSSWHMGYLAKLTVAQGRVAFKPIPYTQGLRSPGAHLLNEPERTRFLVEMEERGAKLHDPRFIEEAWQRHCQEQAESYMASLFGYNRLMRKVRRHLLRLLHTREDTLRALLLTQCETHSEVLNAILKSWRHLSR